MNKKLTVNGKSVSVNVPSNLIDYIEEVFKKNGGFYASKPKNASGDGKYVWRMLAYYFGVRPEMPVTAEFDLDESWWPSTSGLTIEESRVIWKNRREHVDLLDSVVKEILNLFPRGFELGTLRWGRALGVL